MYGVGTRVVQETRSEEIYNMVDVVQERDTKINVEVYLNGFETNGEGGA
jgi:hypothetical protein